MTQDSAPGQPPTLVVVHGGAPEADELAALVVALNTVAAPTGRAGSTSLWHDRRARLRRPLRPGPGQWVASARALR
jgi:hypothetical protein